MIAMNMGLPIVCGPVLSPSGVYPEFVSLGHVVILCLFSGNHPVLLYHPPSKYTHLKIPLITRSLSFSFMHVLVLSSNDLEMIRDVISRKFVSPARLFWRGDHGRCLDYRFSGRN
jgi:hypothetical protein